MSFGSFGSTLKPAASTPSLFGNTNTAQNNQQKPAGGLFGGSSTFGQPQQQQGNTGGGLFGNTNSNASTTNTGTGGGGLFGNTGGNQQQGSSLFGQSNQQQQQPATGGGLFGSTMNTNTGTGGGLFGSTSNNTNTGTSGGGLFGNTSNTNTSNTGTGGGLFGSTTNTNTGGGGLFGSTSNTNTNTGGGLFGSSNANTNNSNTGGGGLFGSTNTNTNTGGGLFGNTQNQQQNQGGGGLFGSTNNSNSLFGAKPSTGAQQPLGMSSLGSQQQGAPPFTKSTRFNDLPDNLKRVFEQIDSHIQSQVQISKDLQQRKMGEEAVKGQQAIRSVHKDLVNAMATINRDLQQAKDLWHKSEQATQDLITGMNIVNGAKNPQAYGAHLKDFAGFPLEYFIRITKEMKVRLEWYKTTLEQAERKLSSQANQAQITPQFITTSLQAQNSAFLALAAKTATLDAELKKIKDLYRKLWREKNASLRDPFNELDRDEKQQPGSQDFGMSQMRVG
ncbi:uncharacterized protein SCHCODRAFT_02627385 [Schizophyllum commune H4-8]|uniref:Nucleoporin Nup54 alpha-helical domain-containing protein n=1 Tax=Schizophyllum commune (strain H4-8 / FGSC 9210) TaxID=578458 RepID=D8Q3U7_SCHCM|nr:uncharacterized protein SCHCODRAFT_02627385 [Schizophyllum commune H4-8]KAI5892883.1 hypothetical protein SCHCODRAFT_02627385 [Schizophyllum commune H4-8]